MYGQPSLRKTNAGWDREAFIAGARYRALNSEARSRELGAFVCGVGDKSSMLNLKSDATTTGYNWGSLHTEQKLSKKFITLKTIGKSIPAPAQTFSDPSSVPIEDRKRRRKKLSTLLLPPATYPLQQLLVPVHRPYSFTNHLPHRRDLLQQQHP